MPSEVPAHLLQLIRDCSHSTDSSAWNELVSAFQRPIGLSVLRTARLWGKAPQSTLEDLVQETYLKLCADRCRALLDFAERHPEAILGYVKTVAANLTHDYFKSRFSQKRGSGNAGLPVDEVESQLKSEKKAGLTTIEQEVLLGQIKECLNACSEGPDQERDRTIFWLYYRQGMTANDIAELPRMGLSAKGVESLIFRLTQLVRQRLVGGPAHIRVRPDASEKGFSSAESSS